MGLSWENMARHGLIEHLGENIGTPAESIG
jgi:hypothetical protein